MRRREEPIPALSAGLSHVLMTGLLLVAAFPALHPGARSVSQPPATSPHASGAPVPSSDAPSPVTAAAPPVKEAWSEDEIVRGREQCMHLLSTTAAEVDWLAPIRKGPCGLPAPVRLKSVGSNPKVVFDPPVDVNCRMVAALGSWVKSTLQPAARERMKSEVVRIVGSSGYSCRNIYNLPNAKLSQHALANAVDIGGFAFADGRTVRVLKGWGLTERDVKALAKARAEASARAEKAKGEAKERKEASAAPAAAVAGRTGKPDKGHQVKQASLSPAPLAVQKASASAAEPAPPAAEAGKPTKESLFLRAVHGGACRAFGTVLGPEANDPHRNHFHLDLIPRRGRGYCE